MAVTLRYFTEFGRPVFQHVTASTCGGIYASLFCSACSVRCRRKESSHSLYITSPDEFLVVFSDENVVIAGPARPSGRRLSVTFVHPTQTIEIFLAMFLCHLVRWPSVDNSDIQVKFYADRSRGTPSSHKRVSQI